MKEHNFGLEPSVKFVITLMLLFPKEKMWVNFFSSEGQAVFFENLKNVSLKHKLKQYLLQS